jgi:hypothetical protein
MVRHYIEPTWKKTEFSEEYLLQTDIANTDQDTSSSQQANWHDVLYMHSHHVPRIKSASLTDSTDERPSWETDSRSGSQDSPSLVEPQGSFRLSQQPYLS